MPAGGFDVFLFQVRHAWGHLAPGRGLPSRFLVRARPRSFEVVTDLADAYLPDDDARTRSLREHGKPILEMLTKEAQGAIGRQLDELEVRRASTLSERCLTDGTLAREHSAAAAVPIEDTELRWLPLVLLTLFAHGGTNPRGPTTGAWRQAKATLRGALVRWCGSLTVELTDGDRVVARREPVPRAHWLSEVRRAPAPPRLSVRGDRDGMPGYSRSPGSAQGPSARPKCSTGRPLGTDPGADRGRSGASRDRRRELRRYLQSLGRQRCSRRGPHSAGVETAWPP